MSTAVKRACDACHRRKVKCDGINPCRNCSSAQLTCTYNAIPQKKGPKGSRAKVISELRETQRQTSLSAKVQSRLNGINSPPHSPTLTPTPGLLAADTIKACVDYFFEHLYSTAPILSRQRLEQQVMYMDQNNSRDTYCLVAAFCAYVMIQPGMRIPGAEQFGLDSVAGANIVSTQLLIDEAIRVRKSFDYSMTPTFNTILTSYFLFAANECMTYHEKAWYYLREAATLMWMVGMNKEEIYGQFDGVEACRRRRLYWLVFVSERAFALQHGRPLTLQATINLPTVNDDPTDMLASRLTEFVMLVNLFRSFDDAFTSQWNKTRGDVTQSYLLALQKQFNEARGRLMNFSEQNSEGTNQQWLKNMTWQLNFQNGTLNSNDPDANMAFQYGMDLSREVMSMQSHFTTSSMEMVGIGMMAKLFEVTLSAVELLVLKPASRNPLVTGVREHGTKIHEIMTVLRSGDHRFLSLLMSKVHEVLPKLCNPLLQEVPECLAQNLADVDIFDGFGNLGMAQPSQPMMKMEDYDHKFVPSISTDPPSSHGLPPSTGDMASPFSPGIMSPSLEIGPGLRDFNSMPEMVMSPVGHASQSMMPQSSMNPQTQQQALTPPQIQQTISPQQMSLSPQQQMPNINQQSNMGMAGMSPQQMQSQGMPGMNQNIMPGQMPIRPQPHPQQHPQQHRSNSFAVQAGMTVADFQALQRIKTEPQTMTIGQIGIPQHGLGMAGQLPLPNEIDFSALR